MAVNQKNSTEQEFAEWGILLEANAHTKSWLSHEGNPVKKRTFQKVGFSVCPGVDTGHTLST